MFRRIDERHYQTVADELRERSLQVGLWAKALAVSSGDEMKAKGLYIRYRAKQIAEEESQRLRSSFQDRVASTNYRDSPLSVILLIFGGFIFIGGLVIIPSLPFLGLPAVVGGIFCFAGAMKVAKKNADG